MVTPAPNSFRTEQGEADIRLEELDKNLDVARETTGYGSSWRQDGRVMGRFVSTGIRPRFAERAKSSSHAIDPKVFEYLNS